MRRGAVVQGGRRRRSQEARPSGPRSPWPCTPAVCSDLPMRPAGHTCSPACLPRNLRSCAVPCCPGSGCPWAPASLPPRPACPQGAAGPCLRAWRPGAPGPRVDRRGCRCRPQGHPCPAASGESPGGTLGPRTLCLAPRHSHGAAPSPPVPQVSWGLRAPRPWDVDGCLLAGTLGPAAPPWPFSSRGPCPALEVALLRSRSGGPPWKPPLGSRSGKLSLNALEAGQLGPAPGAAGLCWVTSVTVTP